MKKLVSRVFLVSSLSLVISGGTIGCTHRSQDHWAQQMLQSKLDQSALIVDVRTPEEYRTGHVATAINVPHKEVKNRLAEFGDDKSKSIVVYCGKGGRANHAEMVLKEAGYQNVVNLGGYKNLAEGLKNEPGAQ